MEVKLVDIKSVMPYGKNPRKITEEAVKKVAASIKEFGFQQPIVVDKKNVIIVGHTRHKAALSLGLTEVPVVVADKLTDAQVAAYRLADNRTGEFSRWDDDLLDEELENLLALDFNMEPFGFDVFFEEEETHEDGGPVDALETNIKLGDIYQLGNHRLMCGDATNPEMVGRLLNGELIDMVFTDPPYGYSYESNHQKRFTMLKNDDHVLDYIPACFPYLKPDTPVYSFCGWQSVLRWIEYFNDTELTMKNMIIWKKNNWSMGDLKGSYAGQYEILLYLNKGRCLLRGSRDTDVWEFDRKAPTVHPTMKPLELIGYALGKSSAKCASIYDAFGGSGSTLIACEQMNRKCFMMELDPLYCQTIVDRWETYTGRKALKVEEE